LATTPGISFTNWSGYEGPLGGKLWLTVRNRSKAGEGPGFEVRAWGLFGDLKIND
jgi:hypothetical protein